MRWQGIVMLASEFGNASVRSETGCFPDCKSQNGTPRCRPLKTVSGAFREA